MATLEIHGLVKRWGNTTAVDGVNFSVESGSFVVLLGPSGCGKSTTLRMIAGLENATEGRIVIAGKDVTHLSPARRNLSMVFQSYALFPHLSVRENILFGLKVRRVEKAERARRLSWAVDLLGLGGLLDRRPGQLSGGQQQRAALGRAIVARSPVTLMDEPLSNLDAKLRHEMRRELRALQQSLGLTMIYVTHDQAEAMSMGDHIILMQSGRIEQQASPTDIYARPDTVFTARFLGTPPMSLLALEPRDGVHAIAGGGPPVVALDGEFAPDCRLLLGLRPEDVRLTDHGGFPAHLEQIEYLGADSVLTLRLGSEELVLRVKGPVRPDAARRLMIQLPPDALHLFDAATGRRVACGIRALNGSGLPVQPATGSKAPIALQRGE